MAQPPIGIDLGTTYSAIAAINPAGRPEIVPNTDGDRVTASAVFFQSDGTAVVGQSAVDVAGAYPDRVVRWVKRELGNPDWRVDVDDRSYSAVDISAMVLAKVKEDAEARLGTLEHAVVTVPAYFDEVRRRDTMDAAEKAGLKVLRIINEPTAAAITYASSGGQPGMVLVYDFGGGTFDVSVVEVKGPADVRVVTSEGDHALGGHDLDRRLAEHYDRVFEKEKGISVREDPGAWFQFLERAERDKRSLSKLAEVRGIPLQWGAHSINTSLGRGAFEELIRNEITRTEMLVDNALDSAELTPDDIAQVILVGGSTRVPAVTGMLARKFGRPPMAPMNVDEAIALGAAIQAGVLMQSAGIADLSPEAAQAMERTRIADVANHAYGTICVENVHGVQRRRNSIIIPKNTPLPATKTETFHTMRADQTAISCTVTQASNNEETDPEFVQVVVEGELPLPPGRPADCPIEVRYSYTADQRMSCEFHDVQSGRRQELILEMSGEAKPTSAASPASETRANPADLLIP